MNIIIEGVKMSGKSTLANLLDEHLRGYSFFVNRSFNVQGDYRYTIPHDIQQRVFAYYSYLNSIKDSKFLLVRGHLWPSSILKGFGQNVSYNMKLLNKTACEMNCLLILLTMDKNTHLKRLEGRMKLRKVRQFDKDWDNVAKQQKAYLEDFSSYPGEKLLFNSSDQSSSDCFQITLKKLQNFA